MYLIRSIYSKKSMVLILVFSLLLSMTFSMPGGNQTILAQSYVTDDNFNSDTTGNAPSGWNLDDVSGGSATVQEDPSASNKSVLLNSTTTSAPVVVSKDFSSSSNIITVEFDAKPGQTNAYLAAAFIEDSAGNRAVSGYFSHTSNDFMVYNGASTESVLTYSPNTWYHVKYVLDLSLATFDVYIDGELKKAGLNFRDTVSGVSRIEFFVGTTSAGTLNYDNVQVFEGGELALVHEVYDEQTTGNAPVNWSMDDVSGGTAKIAEVPSSTNKSVELNDTSTSSAVVISRSFDERSDMLTVEFDAMPSQIGAYLTAGYIEDSAGRRAVSAYFNHTTSEIKTYNGSSAEVVQAYSANTWYHFKYVLDIKSSKYDMYVDGQLKKSGLSFRDSMTHVSRIEFFIGSSTAGKLNFDNLKVLTGGELVPNLVYDDFNSETTGSVPSGWSADDVSGGSATVEEDPSAADKSLELNDTSTSAGVVISKSFTPTTGMVTVEFDARPGQTGAFLAAAYIMDDLGNVAVSGYFNHLADEIRAYNGSTSENVQAYTADTWYKFKYVMDTNTQRYDMYIDGEMVKRGMHFRYSGVSNITKIQFFVGSTTTGKLNINNVKVSDSGYLGPMVINESFDSYTTGDIPTNGGSATIYERSSTNKAVRLYNSSTNHNTVADKEFLETSGAVTYDFRFMAPEYMDAAIGYALNRVETRLIRVEITSAGEIVAYNGSTRNVLRSYTPGTWYQVTYNLDTGTDKFDIYVNNTLEGSNYSFEKNGSQVKYIRFAIPRSETGTLYFDAVKISKNGSYIYYDVFNDHITGDTPPGWTLYEKGWTINAAGGFVTVEGEPSTTDKSLKIYDNSTTYGVSGNNRFGPYGGKVTLEYSMKPEQTTAHIGAGYLYSNDGSRVIRVIFNENGNIMAYNGSTEVNLGTYAAGQWYTMKYVLDTNTKTYDLYINGEIKGSSLGFFSIKSDVALLKFFVGTTTAGTAYVNNVRLYSDEVPFTGVFGADANSTGNPIGGGDGYTEVIHSSSANYVVDTNSELLTALSNATSGQIVYISDSAVLDFTSSSSIPLHIPGGVTLASGRGNNGSLGGMIKYSNDNVDLTDGFLITNGPNVRITGLRLEGPHPEIGDSAYYKPNSVGILSHDYVEVDNNEIYNWSFGGVRTADAYIHHNHIHHTQRTGLGYSITSDFMEGDGILAEANIFDYFRHAIAGNGAPVESYEARYNLVMRGTSHAFDMHMNRESNGQENKPEVAGDWIKIHHNTFTQESSDRIGYERTTSIRAIPMAGCYIHNNWFQVNDTDLAIRQGNAWGNMFVGTNAYGMEKELITGKFLGDNRQY